MTKTPAPYLHTEKNEFGQLLGQTLHHWQGANTPPRQILSGQYVQLSPLDFEQHAEAL